MSNQSYPFQSAVFYDRPPNDPALMQNLKWMVSDMKVIWDEVQRVNQSAGTGTVTSVDMTAPSAFAVGGVPITTSGTIALTAVGTTSDYIDGTGALQAFPSVGGGTVTSVAISPGTAISVTGSPITTSGTITITNTAPDQTVVLTSGTGISITGTYPNFTITNSSPSSGGTVTSVAASAGTGISITGSPITTSGTLNITNTAPDQTVVLTAGTGVSITGTYPNFTITNSAPSTVTPAALTKTDDTNVTVSLVGTPATSLLQAVDLRLGWTGVLSIARGGTNLNALGTALQLLRVNAGASALEYFSPTYAASVTDTATVDLTLSAGALSADVIKQMSITSDASGLKLSGDASAPGNNYNYGTNSSGTKGYYLTPEIPIPLGAGNSVAPAQNQTYYFANILSRSAINTAITRDQLYCPIAGTVTAVYLWFTFGTAGTSVTNSFYLMVNSSQTDTLSTSVNFSGGSPVTMSATGLSRTVAVGDLIAIKWATPVTWATPTANIIINGFLMIRPNIT